MTMSLPDRIQALIEKVSQAIERVENGELFDLGEIDEEVLGVCEAAENPPVEEMELVDEKMDEMMARLEELATALDEFEHTDEDEEDKEE